MKNNAKLALQKARKVVASEFRKHPSGFTLDMLIRLINKNSEYNCDLYAFRNKIRFIPILPKSFQLGDKEK